MRAFIAIDLDPEIKQSLESIVASLRTSRADIRWVRPEGMHLTLKFLGEIEAGQALRVREAMTVLAGRHAPFGLRLEGTGTFPGGPSPRVFWVGFAAEPELLALQRDLDMALESEGFEREERPFAPHLTLGRVKGPDRVAKTVTELDKYRQASFGAMTVRKITLFESVLRPQGAEYRVVFEAGLS